MSIEPVRAVAGTAIDGRLTDLRYRQRQLFSLHEWITAHCDQLREAAEKDDGLTKSEALYLLTLTLNDLRRNYDGLNLKQELREEYSIKRKEDNADRRVAVEKVYVIARERFLVFNVLHVLYPCVTAGSCCVVELPKSAVHNAAALRDLFVSSLDRNVFGIVTQRPSVETLSQFVVVDQVGTVPASTLRKVVASEVDKISAVVVDRTADLRLAAQEIIKSRFAFFAGQPYAPTYVLVNEFVERELLDLLRRLSTNSEGNCHSRDFVAEGHNAKAELEDTEFRVEKLQQRIQLRAERATLENSFVFVLSTSSLDDAIDALNNPEQSALLALYVFADPAASKYLAQFIHTRVSFINGIPSHILAWPAAPRGYQFDPVSLYRREMFERASPQFVNAGLIDPSLDTLRSLDSPTLRRKYQDAARPLRGTGQGREGEANFFTQALAVGIVFYVLPPIVGVIGLLTAMVRWRWKG